MQIEQGTWEDLGPLSDGLVFPSPAPEGLLSTTVSAQQASLFGLTHDWS